MLRLAMELPTVKQKDWGQHTDLDFILAHKVLEDRGYGETFAERHYSKNLSDREVILDNSTHEFGKPLPLDDLREAARRCEADWLIAPDIVNEQMDASQYYKNLEWMRDTAFACMDEVAVAGVINGLTKSDRKAWIDVAVNHEVEMICFSFHISERLKWWKEFVEHPSACLFQRVHILGMMSIEETKQWVRISEEYPQLDFSFDTCKPIKWGVQGKRLGDFTAIHSVRGGKIASKDVLEMKEFTPEQEALCLENIDYLRKLCRGEA